MKFVVLYKDTFTSRYHRAFEKQEFCDEAEQAAFRERVFEVRGAVEDALARKWKEPDDFQVGWDFDYWHHTCGGIYSEGIFCRAYVSSVLRALKSIDPIGEWTYHTTCEIATNHPNPKTASDAMEMRGEMFFRNGTCYINGTGMKRKFRKLLGCAK